MGCSPSAPEPDVERTLTLAVSSDSLWGFVRADLGTQVHQSAAYWKPLYDTIVKITPDGQSIAAVWSSNGKGPGYFDRPAGVALDSQGYIYVMDRFNNRIQKFSSTGTYLSQIATTAPFDVAIGPGDERIYALKNASPATVSTFRPRVANGWTLLPRHGAVIVSSTVLGRDGNSHLVGQGWAWPPFVIHARSS